MHLSDIGHRRRLFKSQGEKGLDGTIRMDIEHLVDAAIVSW